MTDISQSIPLMAALASLKKREPAKYAKLLSDLGVDEYAALDVSRFPPGTLAQCRAMLDQPTKPTKKSTQDVLMDMAFGKRPDNAFADLVADEPTLAGKLNLMAQAAHLKA